MLYSYTNIMGAPNIGQWLIGFIHDFWTKCGVSLRPWNLRFMRLLSWMSGQAYRYAAKAVKQNSESGPSDMVEVSVPPT